MSSENQINEDSVTDSANREALKRLRNVEGQVKGIQRMVEEKKYCVDILNQISAAKAALNKAGMIILKKHINTCVTDAIKNGGERQYEVIDELMKVLEKKEL